MSNHPSYLLLDRLSLGLPAELDRDHLAQCERCQGHLQNLKTPLELPAWARALEADPPIRLTSRFSKKLLIGLCAASAAAAALALAIRPAQPPVEQGVKGAPSIALYIKHGEKVSLWDGQAWLQAGDGVRLKVSPSGFSYLTVALAERGEVHPLFEGAVAERGETVLPSSWTLDDAPGPEHLMIVFSHAQVSTSQLAQVVNDQQRTSELWTTILTLNKLGHAP